MESRSRVRSRRSRWTPAWLFAAVALSALAVAGPAVARPIHISHGSGAALSASTAIAILVIAACAALALVLLASLSGRQKPEAHAGIGEREAAPRHAGHRLAA